MTWAPPPVRSPAAVFPLFRWIVFHSLKWCVGLGFLLSSSWWTLQVGESHWWKKKASGAVAHAATGNLFSISSPPLSTLKPVSLWLPQPVSQLTQKVGADYFTSCLSVSVRFIGLPTAFHSTFNYKTFYDIKHKETLWPVVFEKYKTDAESNKYWNHLCDWLNDVVWFPITATLSVASILYIFVKFMSEKCKKSFGKS